MTRQTTTSPAAPAPHLARNWSDPSALMDDETRLDVPRRGHVLTTAAEGYGAPVREAVRRLAVLPADESCEEAMAVLLPPPRRPAAPGVVRSDAELSAWTVVSAWVVGVATRALPPTAGLADAMTWFFPARDAGRLSEVLCSPAVREAEHCLWKSADPRAYFELLPYILDPHGIGSRLSVRRDPGTLAARQKKRADGVFYTSADVAEYMVKGCLNSIANGAEAPPTVFDPACGTGVFLRAALKGLRRRCSGASAFSLASECLFGADIDPWSAPASAFVLLADILSADGETPGCPAETWRRLRLNIACADTLLIDPAARAPSSAGAKVGAGMERSADGRLPITELFPQLGAAPAIIVGNPPYADIGSRPDLEELGRVFSTLTTAPRAGSEIYVAFIEQLTRLADRDVCAASLVLPISIACNSGPQFEAARKLIQETAGRWRFAFFDREPQALFGEDVKTRNAILFWSRSRTETHATLSSGPLHKWRGDRRAEMFKNIRFTNFEGDIRRGIPRIDGRGQATALQALNARWYRLGQAVHGVGRSCLAETWDADDRTVFVGATAYNFLNVFLRPPTTNLADGPALSENPLHAVRCASAEDALAVYGMLASRLAYWWWRIHGDGFHVTRRFVVEFPFGLDGIEGACAEGLRESGAALWSAVKDEPVVSLNRGRRSFAYSPGGHDDIRTRMDKALISLAGLDSRFVDELQQFTARTVAAEFRGHEHHRSAGRAVGAP